MTDTPPSPSQPSGSYMEAKDILAGAKFYARASAHRAVNGVIPNWDDEADEANWKRTRRDIREYCLDMVRGIIIACEFDRKKDAAFERAREIIAKADKRDGYADE